MEDQNEKEHNIMDDEKKANKESMEDQNEMEHNSMDDEEEDDSWTWCSGMTEDDDKFDLLVYDVVSDDDDESMAENENNESQNENDEIDDNESVMSSDESPEIKTPSWVRLPSEETEYADWQIDIKLNGNTDATSYLVHRYKLGPSSDYFRSIFDGKLGFSESHEKRCAVEFPADLPIDLHLTHFERFLDFFYSGDLWDWKEPEILPLLYLADYFGVERLRRKALEVARYNLMATSSPEWMAETYCLAESLSIASLQNTTRFVALNSPYGAKVLDSMKTSDLKRRFFHRVWMSRKKDSFPDYDGSVFFHAGVTEIMRSGTEIIDVDVFSELTSELLSVLNENGTMGLKPIPLTAKIAIEYLKHEQRLSLNEPDTETLTRLQEGCIRCLLHRQIEVRGRYDSFESKDVVEGLRNLKPAIMQSFLFGMLEKTTPKKNNWKPKGK